MTTTCRAPCIAFPATILLSLLACTSSDRAPDGGAQGGAGPSATGGTHASGGEPGSGGTTSLPAAGGGLGSGGRASSGGVSGSGGSASGGLASLGGSTGSGGVTRVDGGTGGGTGGSAAFDGGLDGPASGGAPGAGGNPGTGGSPGSGGVTGTGGTGVGGTTGGGGSEFGFTYRSPGSHTVSCSGSSGTQTTDGPDMDWLCTFTQAGKKGYVYIRSNASGAQCLMSAIPVYTTDLAQISIDGVVNPLTNAQYDWGGNHHNDALGFDYQGAHYKYYHSSFGFGFRSCQSMDCINVYAVGGTTPTTEGCASTRSLPEVCVQIKAGGTHDPLVDKFAKCPGDSTK